MVDPVELQRTLARIDALATAIGTRARRLGRLAELGAVAAWVLLLRRWIFDSGVAFAAWLPVLVALLVPGLILAGFGGRMLRLGPAVSRIADEAGVVMVGLEGDVGSRLSAARGGRFGALLGALRDVGSRGERIRSLVADGAGTARVLALPYLAAVGLAFAGVVLVSVLLIAGLVSLAF